MGGGAGAGGAGGRGSSILVVEDDALYARLVADAVASAFGADVEVAASAADGIARLGSRCFAAAIVDRRLPDGDGLDVVRRLRAGGSAMPVVFLTADAAPESIVAAMRAGACDYVVKSAGGPGDVARALAALSLPAKGSEGERRGSASLVGSCAAMQRLRATIRRCAASSACVLVLGETGVGKELVARALHEESFRAGGPFVAVNCGALPEHLVESELFGHVKGAFTGAHRDHAGLVGSAARGTLFLDEVEDLPLVLQGKLLRLLQEGEYRPVGAARPRAADVRVVAASNVDLAELVHARAFRGDLFYRLNVLAIVVPALRERHGDIPALVRHLVARVVARAARESVGPDSARAQAIASTPLPPAILDLLERHSWPGNVRELGNCVERAFVLAMALGPEAGWEVATRELASPCTGDVGRGAHGAIQAPRQRFNAMSSDLAEPSRSEHAAIGPADGDRRAPPRDPPRDAVELRQVLDRHRWRRAAAARELGISRVTLWRRMRRLGLCGEEPAPLEGP